MNPGPDDGPAPVQPEALLLIAHMPGMTQKEIFCGAGSETVSEFAPYAEKSCFDAFIRQVIHQI